jgi:hypothetical protein
MMQEGEWTRDGKAVLEAAKRAGNELIRDGRMREETLEQVSRPLVSREELLRWYDQALDRTRG